MKRLRDAWLVLIGRKRAVPVKPATGGPVKPGWTIVGERGPGHRPEPLYPPLGPGGCTSPTLTLVGAGGGRGGINLGGTVIVTYRRPDDDGTAGVPAVVR